MSDGEETPSREPPSGGAAPGTQPTVHQTHPPRAGHQASHLPKVAVPRRLRRLAATGQQRVCHLRAGWPAAPPPLLRDDVRSVKPRPCGNATAAPRHRPAPPPLVAGRSCPAPRCCSSAAQWSCRGPCSDPRAASRSSPGGVAEVLLVRRRAVAVADRERSPVPRCAVAAQLAPPRPSGRSLERAGVWLAAPKALLASWRFPRPPEPPSLATAPGGGHPERPLPAPWGRRQLCPEIALGRRGSPQVAAPPSRLLPPRELLPAARVPPAARITIVIWPLGAAATGFGVRIDLPARFAGLVSLCLGSLRGPGRPHPDMCKGKSLGEVPEPGDLQLL